MRKLVPLALLAAPLAWLAPAEPPATPPAPGKDAPPDQGRAPAQAAGPAFQTWRCAHAYPGDTVALFSPRGLCGQGALTLPAGWRDAGTPVRYNGPASGFTNWCRAVAIPKDAQPGTYPVTWRAGDGSGPHTAQVRVVARPGLKVATVTHRGDVVDQITAAAESGPVVARFEPGSYDWRKPLRAANPVYLDGQGVTRFAVPDDFQGDCLIDLSAGTAAVSATDCLFVGRSHQDAVFGARVSTQPRRLDVLRCRFETIRLFNNWPASDTAAELSSVLVRGCTFRQRAGTGHTPPGTWYDWCEFHGGSYVGEHAWFNAGQPRVLTTNCDWHRTSRGWVNQGGVTDCLAAGCRFFDIAKGEVDGGECLLFENYSDSDATNNAAAGCHAYGCTGPGLILYGGRIKGNNFADLTLGCRGPSIYLAAMPGRPITGNVIRLAECDGPVALGGPVEGNTLETVTVRDFPTSCGNQPAFNGQGGGPNNYGGFRDKTGFPVLDQSQGAGNRWTALGVAGPRDVRLYDRGPADVAFTPRR